MFSKKKLRAQACAQPRYIIPKKYLFRQKCPRAFNILLQTRHPKSKTLRQSLVHILRSNLAHTLCVPQQPRAPAKSGAYSQKKRGGGSKRTDGQRGGAYCTATSCLHTLRAKSATRAIMRKQPPHRTTTATLGSNSCPPKNCGQSGWGS